MKYSVRRTISRSLQMTVIVLLGCVAPLMSVNRGVQSQAGNPMPVELRLVADGLTEPIQVTSAGDGSGRLFVVEKAGTIRVIQESELLPEPFLDISDRVDTSGLERGMLGLAFHPDFSQNGRLFVTHVPVDGAWSLEEYTVSSDPNRVDPGSANQLLFVPNDEHYGGHYGGTLTFGPDGYLYTSIGDGGGEYDPLSHAQNIETLQGSVMRLDIDSGDPYGIPDDNPFVDVSGARPEIWLYGLRNPWRFSFDRETGDLFIGDVGHVDFEEVNYVPSGSSGGINFGWPEMEGPVCSVEAPDCDPSPFEPPIHAYTHQDGCTIIGGHVYRRHPASSLYGRYIFGDYCDGTIWTLTRNGDSEWSRDVLIDTEFNISSFGEDEAGRIYVTDITGGGVYEIVDRSLEDGPVIDRLSQPNIVTGGGSCRIDIIGSGFQEGAVVEWNGIERESERINSQRLRLTIDANEAGQPGTAHISVRNTGPEPAISNQIQLDIVDGGPAAEALFSTWQKFDLPVLTGEANRTWIWGPEPLTCPMVEPYTESQGGNRFVQYFPKARLEFTDPSGEPASSAYVSHGLLATELITGQVQLGDDIGESRSPSNINVAGDIGDTNGPTYATFEDLLDEPAQPAGTLLQQSIDRSGSITDDPGLASYAVEVATVDEVTNHGIAEPFWRLMNDSGPVWEGETYLDTQLFENPYEVIGRPISEPYWTSILVAGRQRDVLIQCFERRCLTYTPDNPEGWQIEAGNTGQHYYSWRYGE